MIEYIISKLSKDERLDNMAKRIQDFREFNSSREETKTSTNSNKNVSNYKKQKAQCKTKSSVNVKKRETISKNNNVKKQTEASRSSNKKQNDRVSEQNESKKDNGVLNFFIILVIFGTIVGCLFSPTFDLTEIIVRSGMNISKEEILNSFDIKKGINVFKINYKGISKSIEELPYIQSANAKLKFPNELKIEYIEREPFALVKYLESYLIMDKYGYILEISREKKFTNLLYII